MVPSDESLYDQKVVDRLRAQGSSLRESRPTESFVWMSAMHAGTGQFSLRDQDVASHQGALAASGFAGDSKNNLLPMKGTPPVTNSISSRE